MTATADRNWQWLPEWPMLNGETTRVLGLVAAASGRAPSALMRLPA